MEIKFKKPAIKALNAMDRPTRLRMRGAIEGLAKKPPDGDIKPMEGSKDGTMRLRVGKYRVLFRYEDGGRLEILLILDIGSRGDIYK